MNVKYKCIILYCDFSLGVRSGSKRKVILKRDLTDKAHRSKYNKSFKCSFST